MARAGGMSIERAVDEIAYILTGNEEYVAKYRSDAVMCVVGALLRRRASKPAHTEPEPKAMREDPSPSSPPPGPEPRETEKIETSVPSREPSSPPDPPVECIPVMPPREPEETTPSPKPPRPKGGAGRPKMVDVKPEPAKPACKRTWKAIRGTWNCKNCGPLPVNHFYCKGDLCKECRKAANLARFRGVK